MRRIKNLQAQHSQVKFYRDHITEFYLHVLRSVIDLMMFGVLAVVVLIYRLNAVELRNLADYTAQEIVHIALLTVFIYKGSQAISLIDSVLEFDKFSVEIESQITQLRKVAGVAAGLLSGEDSKLNA